MVDMDSFQEVSPLAVLPGAVVIVAVVGAAVAAFFGKRGLAAASMVIACAMVLAGVIWTMLPM